MAEKSTDTVQLVHPGGATVTVAEVKAAGLTSQGFKPVAGKSPQRRSNKSD